VVEALVKKPYIEGAVVAVTPAAGDSAPAKGKTADVPPPATGDKPTFKKPSPILSP